MYKNHACMHVWRCEVVQTEHDCIMSDCHWHMCAEKLHRKMKYNHSQLSGRSCSNACILRALVWAATCGFRLGWDGTEAVAVALDS